MNLTHVTLHGFNVNNLQSQHGHCKTWRRRQPWAAWPAGVLRPLAENAKLGGIRQAWQATLSYLAWAAWPGLSGLQES